MQAVHDDYICKCKTPRLQKYLGEESGLCTICGYIYDARLYETRLRQHVEGFTYEDLDSFLRDVDPIYRSLVES